MHYEGAPDTRRVFEEATLLRLLQDPEKGHNFLKGADLTAAIRGYLVKALVTEHAIKALEERDWDTKDLRDDDLKWTIMLRWADD